MAFFDQLVSGKNSQLVFTPREAFATVMLVAIAADGEITDEESEGFIAVSNRMLIFKSQPAAEFNQMVKKLLSALQRQGPNALLSKAAEVLPDPLKETAFAVAADLLFADGNIAKEEEEALARIQATMGVPDTTATKIADVLMIKNRGDMELIAPKDSRFCTNCGNPTIPGNVFCSGCGQRL